MTKELEKQLAKAQERLDRAMKALAPKHKGGEMEEYRAAHAELLRLEREVASAKGEEHAVPLGFPVQWDIGAPLPHLLVNDYRTGRSGSRQDFRVPELDRKSWRLPLPGKSKVLATSATREST